MNRERKRAVLRLEGGAEFKGWMLGYDGPCDGEAVFSTAMIGCHDDLRAGPSHSGRILGEAYRNVGN